MIRPCCLDLTQHTLYDTRYDTFLDNFFFFLFWVQSVAVLNENIKNRGCKIENLLFSIHNFCELKVALN